MAVNTTTRTDVPARHASHDPGYGWILFASVLVMVLATLNLIEGLAAVGGSHFFVRKPHYIVGNLTAWGWLMTVIGTLQYLVGVALLLKNQLARWAAVALLSLNVIAELLFMPAYPFWSLTIIALDIVALYGVVVYGELTAASGQNDTS